MTTDHHGSELRGPPQYCGGPTQLAVPRTGGTALAAPGPKQVAARLLVPDRTAFGRVGHVVPHSAVPGVTSRTAVRVQLCPAFRTLGRVAEPAKRWRILQVVYVDGNRPTIPGTAIQSRLDKNHDQHLDSGLANCRTTHRSDGPRIKAALGGGTQVLLPRRRPPAVPTRSLGPFVARGQAVTGIPPDWHLRRLEGTHFVGKRRALPHFPSPVAATSLAA